MKQAIGSAISLGIDVGGTSVKCAARASDGSILVVAKSETYERPDTETLIRAMRNCLARINRRDVRGVGLCVPGILDRERRIITLAVNVPGVVDVRLDDLVSRAMGTTPNRVEIVNDAIAAATDFVRSHALRGRTLALCLGTGVGAAVIEDDGWPLLVDGDSPGHFGMVDVSIAGEDVIGPDGGGGSLEGYLGAHALRIRYGNDPARMFEMMTANDVPIRALVRAIRIGHAIYRPQNVVLLGGVGIRLRPLAGEMRDAVNARLTRIARAGWQLRFGDDDFHAARGAARIVSDPRESVLRFVSRASRP